MTMPLIEQRIRYLTHHVEQGVTKQTLCHVAQTQLVVIEQLGLTADGQITSKQIEAAADRWAALQLRQRKTKDCRRTRMRFLCVATRWLRFLGRLDVPALPPSPYAHLVKSLPTIWSEKRACLEIRSALNVFTSKSS